MHVIYLKTIIEPRLKLPEKEMARKIFGKREEMRGAQ
jgi:hypothetical protein